MPSTRAAGTGLGVPLLGVSHLVKRFGPVTALDDVSLDVYPNDVLGIVGDNGAGKSTFLSVLSGYYRPDAGELRVRGNPANFTSPARTRRNLGIEMVYQDLAMSPDLSVWQNLFLGEERLRLGLFLDVSTMRAKAIEVLGQMGTKIRPDWLLGELSGGERQLVAVARGLLFDRDILLLDEPTAAVSAAKANDVLDTIRAVHGRGKTVILISHRLEDILAVCTRVAVFVTGQVRYVVDREDLDLAELIHMMFGERAGRGGSVSQRS